MSIWLLNERGIKNWKKFAIENLVELNSDLRLYVRQVLKRRKYLCVDEVQERSNFVYGFACLPDGPPYLNAIWYTLCGTAIRNRAQFLTNIFSFTILISAIFLKGILTDQEIERIRRRLPSIESLLRFLKERRRRAAAETCDRLENSSITKSPSNTGVSASDAPDRSEHD